MTVLCSSMVVLVLIMVIVFLRILTPLDKFVRESHVVLGSEPERDALRSPDLLSNGITDDLLQIVGTLNGPVFGYSNVELEHQILAGLDTLQPAQLSTIALQSGNCGCFCFLANLFVYSPIGEFVKS